MVKFHQRYNQWRKCVDEEDDHQEVKTKRGIKTKLHYFVFLSFLCWCLILISQFLISVSTFSFHSQKVEEDELLPDHRVPNSSICSSVSNGTICCERRSFRSDICTMKGDVRTHPSSSSIFLYNDMDEIRDHKSGPSDENKILQLEKIRPYTRKWEANTMINSVQELHLVVKKASNPTTNRHKCDIKHDVPAVIFSAGGYTGNAYHDINDGILPLYITSQHFNKKVIFVILDYHNWWYTKYRDVLSQLSDYPVINFNEEKRKTHCFPEAIVGLRIHDELSLDPLLMEGANVTIVDFRNLLDRAYMPRIKSLMKAEEKKALLASNGPMQMTQNSMEMKPKLAIISRKGSREVTNENSLVKLAEDMGFVVQVLKPDRTTELAILYRDLNSSDVMIGVHGAAMTYLLFMNPGSVFIQIIPLGLDWAAEKYYEEPAVKLGLKYIGYKIIPKESSLFNEYERDDPVLIDPESVNEKGWEFTKKVYLDKQKVKLNVGRFKTQLLRAYEYSVAKKKSHLVLQPPQ